MVEILAAFLMSSDVAVANGGYFASLALFLIAILKLIYAVGLFGLAFYGLNSLITTILFWLTRKRQMRIQARGYWPRVTVQLPIFNERYTVERLLAAVTALEYPAGKLQIQVLDDSTDDTAQLTRDLVENHRLRGLDISLIQRTDRTGFKAGALAEGMRTARGELLAIFDADFIPPPDWLKQTVYYFGGDPRLACLQTRWGHVNQKYSLFTSAQALGIDGHFIVEQAARSDNGLFLNFNGTAGLWRKAAILDAGGWQPDTLTEDLDLSYRAQLRGWHIQYLPQVVVPAELPVQVEAFKKQQFRWAKGSFQVVRKLFAAVLQAHVPVSKRLMGLVHITGYFVHPLMLTTFLLVLPVGVFAPDFLSRFPWLTLTAFGPPLLFMAARSGHSPRLIDRIRLLPVLVMIGFGLTLNNTVAVLQGLFSQRTGTFVRTPKLNVMSRNDRWTRRAYRMRVSPLVWGELALGVYALLSALILTERVGWGVTPWLLFYAAGYFYIAGMNLLQSWQSNQVAQPAAARA